MSVAETIQLGVCSVVYNGVNLGETEGGVTLNFNYSVEDILGEQVGGALLAKFGHSPRATAETQLKQTQKDVLYSLIPGSELVGSGEATRLGLGENFPLMLPTYPLILHPLSKASSDKTADTMFPKATVTANISQARTLSGVWLWRVVFDAIYDPDAAVGKKLIIIGDPSI